VQSLEFEVTVKEYAENCFLVAEDGRILGEAKDIAAVFTGALGQVIPEGESVRVLEVVRVWQICRPEKAKPARKARRGDDGGMRDEG
jgi:hypothetical protein